MSTTDNMSDSDLKKLATQILDAGGIDHGDPWLVSRGGNYASVFFRSNNGHPTTSVDIDRGTVRALRINVHEPSGNGNRGES